ncbi:unnamed protein product [Cylicocyclus nassatus]|uniref:Uncharacterized protein n=1 Tax=Cylicocyclus nassatus TaxID=53992 RepID=A0AA36H162_CYLNA|nr:unnamed protein product [Cylicocyclus nassatus]
METFALMVFPYNEMCVSPRTGTQLDYFIFPMMVGRLLSSALATLMPSIGADQIIIVVLLSMHHLMCYFPFLVIASEGGQCRILSPVPVCCRWINASCVQQSSYGKTLYRLLGTTSDDRVPIDETDSSGNVVVASHFDEDDSQ